MCGGEGGKGTSNKYQLLYLFLDRKHIILCGIYATYTSLQHCNYLEVSCKQRTKRKKKRILTYCSRGWAWGGHEADGPCGHVGVRTFCGLVWTWIPVKKKEKSKGKRKEKSTYCWRWAWACRWAVWKCCHVGMRMGVQTCGHVDVDGCKQKRKKEKTNLAGWACGWVCGHAGVRMGVQLCGHADVDGCKQKGKRKKEKNTY